MADSELPCFSFRPNWAAPVTERLSFLTRVHRAEEGAEQRRAVRRTPRRSLEADFLLEGPERTFFDLFMHTLAGGTVTVPLYWDIGILTSPTATGVTTRLDFDTRWTAFEAGKAAIIQGDTALDYEIVEIDSVDDTGIDLAAATANDWKAGTRVMPLRRALLDDIGDLTHPSAQVAGITSRFLLQDENPWTPASDPSTIYATYPIFDTEPNWVDRLASDMQHDTIRFDPDMGLPYQIDPILRANVGQAHRWFLDGREELATFRDLVYRHQGRRGTFWLPTFKADLELLNSPSALATSITVRNVGMSYVGGPSAGREYLVIWTWDGTMIPRKITSVVSAGDQEIVGLDAALGHALSPSLVRKISFMDIARFDQDDFELTHHVDSRGLTEIVSTFRTFKNTRDPSGAIELAIPTSEMDSLPCGNFTPLGTISIDVSSDGGSNIAAVLANGVTLTGGFDASDTLYLLLLPQTYGAWSPWGDPSPVNSGTSGSLTNLWVIPDGNTGASYVIGNNGLYDGYEAARQAWGVETLTGADSYTFGIVDSPIGDNSGGMVLTIFKGG